MMKQTSIKQIAHQRITILYEQAQKLRRTNPKLATEYVALARRIAMAARIRMPQEYRRQTCRQCNSFFVHGVNCRVRVKQKREPHVVVTCLNCGNQTRYRTRKKVHSSEQDNHKDETSR